MRIQTLRRSRCHVLSSLHLAEKQETQIHPFQTRTFLHPRQMLSNSRQLCATDEDVVNGDVNQLDDVADEAHDED